MNKKLIPLAAMAAFLGLSARSSLAQAVANAELDIAQRVAVGQMNDNTAALSDRATSAASDLTAASLNLPVNTGRLLTLVNALGAAELELALARADSFEAIQKGPNRLSAAQLPAVTGAGGGGGRGGRAPVVMRPWEDDSGFVSMFDGRTLNGWNGESDVWSIDDGAIHADTTITPGQHHLHYVGPNNIFGDFDLKVEVKMSETGANGGIQYRSRLLNAAHSRDGQPRGVYDPAVMADPFGVPLPAGVTTVTEAEAAIPGLSGNPWQVSGYQFDLYSNHSGTGQLYEGQGSRFILTSPGYIVQTLPGSVVVRIGTLLGEDENGNVLNPSQTFGKVGDWNDMEIIARGSTLIHMVNGHIVSVTTDDDPYRRALSGMLSLQLEGGGQIWYRNIRVRHL